LSQNGRDGIAATASTGRRAESAPQAMISTR
jgi:hypothetical protein